MGEIINPSKNDIAKWGFTLCLRLFAIQNQAAESVEIIYEANPNSQR
jgi:hypothetical protein